MNENIQNEQNQCCVEDDFPPPPPPEWDWRLCKYFDAMNNADCCPDPPEFEEIEDYLSNCTDTDIDESASVLYAYNYLKEYMQHMKSAKKAKDNLMSVIPSQQLRSPTSPQDSDTSPKRYQNSKSASGDEMELYDHLSGKEECYYASMQIRPGYKPQMDVRRTLSDGPDKIPHLNGYAIPYVTRHRTMPQNQRPHLHGTVSVNYPNNIQHHDQAEVVEICSPTDTSMSSTPYWLHRPPGRNERIVYESIDKIERHESDEYFLPRAKEKQSTTDSSNSNQNISNEANRTNQKRRKFKRPNNRSKIYVTTNKVFNQPIIHSKECLDSLNSDEVRPCNCLKSVLANQKNKQPHSPSKNVHVMESIPDGEISNFNQNRKKKLNRTRGVDDWGVDYPQLSYNSSDNLYPDEFDTYDHVSNHAFASRSLTSYNSSTANGSTNDSDSMLVHSGTHIPYNKENLDESSDDVSRSTMYLPSERWNFAFVPHKPNQNGRSKVTRFHSVDVVTSSENRSVERSNNLEDFKSSSSFGSKNSSKSDQNSSSCSSRCSTNNDSRGQNKNYTKSFFKSFSPKISKKHNRSPVKGQVSEL